MYLDGSVICHSTVTASVHEKLLQNESPYLRMRKYYKHFYGIITHVLAI